MQLAAVKAFSRSSALVVCTRTCDTCTSPPLAKPVEMLCLCCFFHVPRWRCLSFCLFSADCRLTSSRLFISRTTKQALLISRTTKQA